MTTADSKLLELTMYSTWTRERDKSSCHFAHEANCAAAIDELGVCLVESSCKGAGSFHVHWRGAFRCATASKSQQRGVTM